MFRIVRTVSVAAVCMFAAAAAAQSGARALLSAAVAATQAAKTDYAFDLNLETPKQTWSARFEPHATPRLRLVQPRRDELTNDERRAFDRLAEQMEGVSWCASEGLGRVDAVSLVREDETSAVYAFQPSAESVRGQQARRFADRLRGELTLLKASPDIARIRIYAPQPFSPMPLVRVETLDVAIACQTAPNGRRYAADTVTVVRGRAFGQAFNERTAQHARNLAPP